MKKSIIATILVLFWTTPSDAQSTVTVNIDQSLLNRFIEKLLPVSFTKKFEGDFGFIPWSVTPIITINSMNMTITEGRISSRARVSIRADNLSYTETATGTVTPRIVDQMIIFETTSLIMPLYIKPLGNRIDLGNQEISGLLPEKTRKLEIDLLNETINLDISPEKSINLRLSNPVMDIQSGNLTATAHISVIE